MQRSQSLSDEILKQANQPISLPGGASLKLPSPSDRGAFLSLENSGKLFNEGIDKLLTYLKEQSATSKKGSNTNTVANLRGWVDDAFTINSLFSLGLVKTISPKNSFKVSHKVFLTYCPQYKGSDSPIYLGS